MSTLTDRYVHATLRSVPEGRRADIGAELRASVSDMVEARVDAGEEPAAAERAVLTELGDPALLASRYTDSSLVLIGPRWFLVWKRVLVTLLLWVPATVAVVVATVQVFTGADLGGIIGRGISAGITTAVQIAFWTTLTFAVVERVGVDAGLPAWTVDRLPELPEQRDISLADTVAGVVFLGLVAAALVGQNFRSWVTGDDGDDVAVLDPALWSSWLPVLLASVLASIAIEVWKYRAGRWTIPIAVANVVAGLAFLLPVAWLASRDALLNPAFVRVLDLDTTGETRVGTGIVVGAVLVVAYELGEGFWRAWTARRRPSAAFEPAGGVR